ncbi:MAG: AarF/UbiB family protein [Myxococcota bacterium]|nr:AarF/UbiB family protein [Myxococcota bacterium]
MTLRLEDKYEGRDNHATRTTPSGEVRLPNPPKARALRSVRARLRTSGVEPAIRIVGCALASLLELFYTSLRGRLSPGPASAEDESAALRRIAERWARLLGSLRGAYVKAGQFAATRPDLIPEAATAPLAALRDRVPPLPLAQIRDVIESELGQPLHQAFPEFDPTPLGAASIAQVHRATLPDGTPVVVKVQYPWLQASLAADLKLLRGLGRILLWLGARGRWRADFERFFAEFADGLADELDFTQEARAAAEIAENLADDPAIQVPEIVADLSRRRVLTMLYFPCIGLADRPGLEALGVQPAQIVEILARAYARQVFKDGLFHADPHPGNLFVIDEAGAQQSPRVLFVDFGLHRRLSPELRNEMRQGIFALMQRDADRFIERMKALDMIAPGAEAGVHQAVSSMLERIASEGGSEGLMQGPGSQVLGLKDEAKRLLQETPGLQLPNDLLLYAKTLSYLFALAEDLAPEVDVMKISVPYLLEFLGGRD